MRIVFTSHMAYHIDILRSFFPKIYLYQMVTYSVIFVIILGREYTEFEVFIFLF